MSTKKSAPDSITPEIYQREHHDVSRKDIDPDALKIMYRLIRNGYKAYLVGGGVRDILLGTEPKDFDIATDARPNEIKSLFRNSRVIGRRFKLVHIFFRNKNIEVSTFRALTDPIDIEDAKESEGLKPIERDNTYGNEATDALRRDITINGLFYDPSTYSIIDYVGGMRDLYSRIIRVIGDPEVRFQEDPVRMLRVVRHAARSGSKIDEQCVEAISKNLALIELSSAVRVFEEFKKDLCSGASLSILSLLFEAGLLQRLLPLITENAFKEEPDVSLVFSLDAADKLKIQGWEPSPTVMLSLLVHFTAELQGEDLEVALQEDESGALNKYFSHLAVPRKEKERIATLLLTYYQLKNTPAEKRRPKQYARRAIFDDLLMLTTVLEQNNGSRELSSFLQEAKQTRSKPPAGRNRSRPQTGAAPRRKRRSNTGRGGEK